MPNGGPDCCGNCSHNKAVQEIAHPQPWAEFNSYCTLRKVGIKDAFWTYCNNFEYGKSPETRQISDELIGPITSSGLYEGYVRIPWLGSIAPSVVGDNDDGADISCSVCGFKSKSGITLEINSGSKSFCTNRHYLEWWNQQVSESERWSPDFISQLETPEKRYESDGSSKSSDYRLSVSEAKLRNSESKSGGKTLNWGVIGAAVAFILIAVFTFLLIRYIK